MRLFFSFSRDPTTSSNAFQLAFDGFAPGGDGDAEGDDDNGQGDDANFDQENDGDGDGDDDDDGYGIPLGELQSSLQQRFVGVVSGSGTTGLARPAGHASDVNSSIAATYAYTPLHSIHAITLPVL